MSRPEAADHDHAHGGHGHHDHDHDACQHAHDHARSAGAGLARAERICRERGLRLTPIRRKALEALYADHRPVGAYDLADRVSPPGGRRLAPISIYRALEFLVEQGFVHRLSSRNAFIACPHGHGAGEAVAFLICESCGGVDEDASTAMREAVRGMAEQRRFKPRQQVVEIVGLCEHCRGTESA
jgi:Fur family zinc uptake transcriptional regulator